MIGQIKTAAQVRDEILEELSRPEHRAACEKLHLAPNRREKIKAYYELKHDDIIKSSKNGVMSIDIYDFDWDNDWMKSPPEYSAFLSTRTYAMPMYPQYPVAGYYLDFGDPYRKIGIEIDGKTYHDPERDMERDMKLAEFGWTIFRCPAFKWQSKKESPDEDFYYLDGREKGEYLRKWISHGLDGFVYAVNAIYYKRKTGDDWTSTYDLDPYGYDGHRFIQECKSILLAGCNTDPVFPEPIY